jgi:hypothetical protein
MNEKLLDIYKKFLELRFREKGPGKLADYKWYSLPESLPLELMAYSQMLSEHSQELSNSINELYRFIVNLKTWDQILHNLDEDFKYRLIIEMIDPFATLSINLVYVIRSRFIYSTAHLCHQANMVKFRSKWKDDLPDDEEIYFQHADKVGSSWQEYSKLKLALEKVGNKKFTEATKDFRNKYNHRYSPSIEIGHTEFIKRKVGVGQVSYGMGHTEPLKLAFLVPLLSEQYVLFLRAYDYYKKLVFAHITVIEKGLKEINFKN